MATGSTIDAHDASLAGLVAWYSIIPWPPTRCRRRSRSSTACFSREVTGSWPSRKGDDVLHFDEAFGHEVSLDFRRLQPDTVETLLDDRRMDGRVHRPLAPNR